MASRPCHRVPLTHQQALQHFNAHWRLREYAAAAKAAHAAEKLAASDPPLANKYRQIRRLAQQYDQLRAQQNRTDWRGDAATQPILTPDDPASSEARCNMSCAPDRPIAGQALMQTQSSDVSASLQSDLASHFKHDQTYPVALCCLPLFASRTSPRY